MKDPNTGRYPAIEPYKTGRLRVSEIHELYYEESGNPNGKPVVFLHGGPGSGTDGKQRTFFDPNRYRIILFDQRGSGKSTPFASLEENTTWDLVADIEKLREHLGIKGWQVFGGSWGSTLALAYSETHPKRVTELVLRGIFLIRKKEIDWFYQEGASFIYPETFEPYLNFIPKEERGDLVKAYYKRMIDKDPKVQLAAAREWSKWEATASKLYPDENLVKSYAAEPFCLAFGRIESHYFINEAFFEVDGQLIRDAHKIKDIPTVIVHGRYDVVCPLDSAYQLHKQIPHAELKIIPDAGHSAFEPGISKALVEATEKFSK